MEEVAAVDRSRLPVPYARGPPESDPSARGPPPAAPASNISTPPPSHAPSVLICLMDDLGFAGTSAHAGPANTPTFDAVAQKGVLCTNFNMTPLCSPSRTCLQSGRNHNVCNVGAILETSTGYPGNTGNLPNDCALLPEILRLNGYATCAVGKWHMTDLSEINVGGPTTRWPNMVGYDRFYGFMGGASSAFASVLWDDMTQVSVGGTPEFDLGSHFADKACEWLTEVHALRPDKPTLLYFASGGVHTPHDLPPRWVARADEKVARFRQGWDVIRREVIDTQKKLGIVPADLVEPDLPKEYRRWEDCPAEERELFARQAATYATYVEKTDHDFSRVLSRQLEVNPHNTLVVLLYGDNGSSAYGLQSGYANWLKMVQDIVVSPRDLLPFVEEWGSEETYTHFANAWCQVFDAPFALCKGVTSFGGTRVGAAFWHPRMICGGRQETGYMHVVDVAPTILEACRVPQPTHVNGIAQFPMQGVSQLQRLAASGSTPLLPAPRRQFFAMLGNTAMYYDGFFARRLLLMPWEAKASQNVDLQSTEGWELYTPSDFALAKDVATEQPAILARIVDAFLEDATASYAFPLTLDNMQTLQDPRVAGRRTLFGDRRNVTLHRYFHGLNDASFIDMKNGSWRLETELSCSCEGCSGAVFSNGSRFNGFALYVVSGVPVFLYSMAGSVTKLSGTLLRAGQVRRVRIFLAYEEQEAAHIKGGPATVTLCEDEVCVSSKRLGRTIPNRVNVNDVASVGRDMGSVMVPGCGTGDTNTFQGEIAYVSISLLSSAEVADELGRFHRFPLERPPPRRPQLRPSLLSLLALAGLVLFLTLMWLELPSLAGRPDLGVRLQSHLRRLGSCRCLRGRC